MNVGEELVASYLQHIKGCDFTQKNLYTPDVQGEIDVFGVSLKQKAVYVCEVAVHLVTGLQYVKDRRPNNVEKLTQKFCRDIDYTQKYFPDYQHHFMLWSPIVKLGKVGTMYNQEKDLDEFNNRIKSQYGVTIEFVVNEVFLERLNELRHFASRRTEELKCPVLRLFQIEQFLIKHLETRTPTPGKRTTRS
jgi:hypothetical protein